MLSPANAQEVPGKAFPVVATANVIPPIYSSGINPRRSVKHDQGLRSIERRPAAFCEAALSPTAPLLSIPGHLLFASSELGGEGRREELPDRSLNFL
jgi:hypothetical protein